MELSIKQLQKYNGKDIPQLLKIAEKHFNRYIRQRDSNGGDYFQCISCGQYKRTEMMHAGHYMSAGHNGTVRFNPDNVRSLAESFQTQTTRQSMGLVMPVLVENKGQSLSRPITDPTGCITTRPHQGIVTDESFNSFLASYYNGSHCTKHITQEMGSVTTNDRHTLVSYQKPELEDCYYRMLKPPEIKLGMAFDSDYIILGSGKDQVKQLGKAVTPPAMEWLVDQVIQSLS